MFKRLLPQETSFFDFFDQHAALTVEAAKEFLDFASAPPATGIGPKAKRIKELEHEADTITHRCVDALHRTFITPIDREDIHKLIGRLDDVMDLLNGAMERMALYEVGELKPSLRDLAELLVQGTQVVAQALQDLRRPKRLEAVQQHCVEIHRLENDGDAVFVAALAKLFKEEQDPIAVIKWKEIFEFLEEAMDRCEDVANTIEGIVLEST